MERKQDILETMPDEELLRQVFENPPEAPIHHQAAFLINYRLALQQERFNRIVTVATVVMAVQAIIAIIALCLGR